MGAPPAVWAYSSITMGCFRVTLFRVRTISVKLITEDAEQRLGFGHVPAECFQEV